MLTKLYFAIFILFIGIFNEFTGLSSAEENEFKGEYCRDEAEDQALLPVKFQDLYTQILELCANPSATSNDTLEFKANTLTGKETHFICLEPTRQALIRNIIML